MSSQLRLSRQVLPSRSALSRCAGSKLRASSRFRECEASVDLRGGSESPPAFRIGTSPQESPSWEHASDDPLAEALSQCRSMLELKRSGSESPPVFWGPSSASSVSSLGGRPHCRGSMVRSCVSTCAPSDAASPHSCSPSGRRAWLAASGQRVLHRELLAELSLLEKDRRIEVLEARIRDLEDASRRNTRPEAELSHGKGATFATAADVEALCRKSEGLIGRLALSLSVDADSETRHQTRPPLRGSRLGKDSAPSLVRMEVLVQRKLQRITRRTTHSLCAGRCRSPPRYRKASGEI